MKRVFGWIFALLGKVGKDKYQHFTLGAIIAAVVFVAIAAIGRADVAWWLSLIVVFCAETFKEFVLDAKADLKDVVATMLGWASVGVPLFGVIFMGG